MKEFNYVVNDPLGLHARPAGMLAKAAKEFADTTITITKGPKTVKATQLMMIMGLAVKNGDQVTVRQRVLPRMPPLPPWRSSSRTTCNRSDFRNKGTMP